MNAEQQRVSSILLDSLALLCKNTLTFSTELTVQGLIGITVDKENVFLVHINERFVPDETTQSIKQEPCYEREYADPDIQQEPFRKDRNRKPGARSRKFRPAEEAVPERAFGRDVKSEVQYEDYEDDYGYADRAENQAAFADVKPMSVMRQMQVTYGGRGHPTAVTSTIVTESYDMVEGDCGASQGVIAEPVDDVDDVPWASEDDMMQFPPGQPLQQEFVPNQNMWKPNSSSRGFKSKRAVRGRPAFVRSNQGIPPSRMGPPKAPPAGVGRLKVSPSNPYVINETSHLCGYPNCGKRFRFRHDLLRHQTKKHGRTPVSRGRGSSMSYGFEEYA